MAELGKLVPPFPTERCMLDTCHQPLTTESGAYLFTDLESGKLVVFCGTCAPVMELNHGHRFKLVML